MIPAEHGQLKFGSTVVRYTIARSARRKKTVEVQVVGGQTIRVAAPAAASREKIERLLRGRSRWLINHVKRSPAPRITHEFVNGETFLYLGRQARLRIRETRAKEAPSVRLVRGRLEVRVRATTVPGIRKRRVREALEEWYRVRAEAKLRERVEIYSVMLGVHPTDIMVRDQGARWGSCNQNGVLRFNWRIVRAPLSAVDYVVVHELSHLAGNKEHAAAFWKTLAGVIPDFEERRQTLRRRGREFVA